MKKQVMITLLAMLVISILPGCGKSKNGDGSIIGGGGVLIPGVGGYSSITAAGNVQLSNASGRIYGALNAGGSPSAAGAVYTRTNHLGDSVTLYIQGNTTGYGTGYSNAYATVVVNLGAGSTAYFTQCGAAPSLVGFQGNQLVGGSPGNIPETIVVQAGGGCFLYL